MDRIELLSRRKPGYSRPAAPAAITIRIGVASRLRSDLLRFTGEDIATML